MKYLFYLACRISESRRRTAYARQTGSLLY